MAEASKGTNEESKGTTDRAESQPGADDSCAEMIRQIRRNDAMKKSFEVRELVVNACIEQMYIDGELYRDGTNTYYLLKESGEVLLLERGNDQLLRFIANKFGINSVDTLSKYVVEGIRAEGLKNGKTGKVSHVSWYDSKAHVLYMSNHDRQVYRITESSVDCVTNGTDDVLFLDRGEGVKFTYTPELGSGNRLEDIFLSHIPFDEGVLSATEMKCLLSMWVKALLFRSILPTRPVLVVTGPKGASKTTTLRRIGRLIYGQDFEVFTLTSQRRDLDVVAMASTFLAIDNADSPVPWFEDRLATMSTGANVKMRQLYTTNTVFDAKLDCFVGISSRTPYFRREDVAERCLILPVMRLAQFRSEAELQDELLQHRDALLSEVIHQAQQVIAALKAVPATGIQTQFRLADFATFALRIANHTGTENQMRMILRKMQRVQESFSREGNDILRGITVWSRLNGNAGRKVTSTELCEELTLMSDSTDIDFPYRGNPRGFAQRLSRTKSELLRFIDVDEHHAGGRKRYFSFRPRDEAEP